MVEGLSHEARTKKSRLVLLYDDEMICSMSKSPKSARKNVYMHSMLELKPDM